MNILQSSNQMPVLRVIAVELMDFAMFERKTNIENALRYCLLLDEVLTRMG